MLLRMTLIAVVVLPCSQSCYGQEIVPCESPSWLYLDLVRERDQPAGQASGGEGSFWHVCTTAPADAAPTTNPDREYLRSLRGTPKDSAESIEENDNWPPCRGSIEASEGADVASARRAKRAATIAKLESLPLPSHTIEGYGGGAITPVAYLVNPGKEGTIFGGPAVSVTNVVAGKKNAQVFVMTETLLRRIEFGYALARVDLGTLPSDVRDATGVSIADDLRVHNLNARLLLLDETAFANPWLPSLTTGVHFKVNDGIEDINDRLGNGLGRLGYEKSYGTDFTLTASKTVIHPITFGRPLFLTVGARNSRGAQLGVFGFAGQCHTTLEAGVGYLLTNRLLVNYEFRQKNSPYQEFPGLIGPEDNWHAVGVSLLLSDHLIVNAGWAALGTVANSVEDGAWYLQMKYDF